MDTDRFAQDKSIDPSRLDLECVTQTDKFFYWAQLAMIANAAVDKAKLHLEVVKAHLDVECRRDPTEFGIAKPTEAAVDAAVRCHSKYQQAYARYLDAKEEARLLDIAVATMEQKKRMLEHLITLHGQQYFAGPSVPRDLVSEWCDMQKHLSTDVNQQQKSITRKRGQRR